MWKRAKVWLAITLATLGCAATQLEPLGKRILTERPHIAVIDVAPIATNLAYLWQHTDSVEWLACAQGSMHADTLRIDALELANMTQWSPTYVYGTCRLTEDFVGTVHPHKGGTPDWACQPSDIDMASFMGQENEAFMFIECDAGRLWVSTEKIDVGATDLTPATDTVKAERPSTDST